MPNNYSSEEQRRRVRIRWGDPIERFWKSVDKSAGLDACWPWGELRDKHGYGRRYFRGRQRFSHRIAYELHYGTIDDSMGVLHKCDNPPCCNPFHLFQGDQLANMSDCKSKNRVSMGVRHTHARLNDDWVRFIRLCVDEKLGSYREIGEYFGIAIPTVCDIVKRRTWAHVT